MNDNIENEIQRKGLTAPRLTPDDIESTIASEHYFTAAAAIAGAVSDAMVNRFLGWRLPDNFTPDCGISFARDHSHDVSHGPVKYEPTGTNLLDAIQARKMLEEVVPEYDVPAPLRLLTFCVLTLHNGFTVTGESACASPENFDDELGRSIARKNAVAKIWPLLGYELRSKLAAV